MTDQSAEHMLEIAAATVRAFPAPFASLASDVAIHVEDWPPRALLAEMEIDDPIELTGLYEGIPLTEKSHFDQPMMPDTVFLFRKPILAELEDRAADGVTFAELVAHVTVHEFAHHFGWSDDDIAAIDPWWE
ncbi:metallopeptidase family protein [Shimia biformata]|uniref:metallopeptidase family protein n=1 Tax=Shimia biformata TaxID=1294299 RepID=UPI0019527B8C|nr:metallopeptidase family protein [Shimia biformata]